MEKVLWSKSIASGSYLSFVIVVVVVVCLFVCCLFLPKENNPHKRQYLSTHINKCSYTYAKVGINIKGLYLASLHDAHHGEEDDWQQGSHGQWHTLRTPVQSHECNSIATSRLLRTHTHTQVYKWSTNIPLCPAGCKNWINVFLWDVTAYFSGTISIHLLHASEQQITEFYLYLHFSVATILWNQIAICNFPCKWAAAVDVWHRKTRRKT